MKIQRRGFLGLIGGVVASGPKAATETISSLSLDKVGTLAGLAGGENPVPYPGDDSYRREWAAGQIAKRLLRTKLQMDDKCRRWRISALDADTASLRSMSLGAKIKRSTRIQFKEFDDQQGDMLQQVLAGLDD